MDRIVIPLCNNYKLTVEKNTGEFDKELYISIEDPSGSYVQDLAIVRPTYKLKDNEVEFDGDKFEILVFGDAEKEEYTDKHTIPLRTEDE